MGNFEMAVLALVLLSAIGFLLADGEKRRLKWVQAMRRCLLRLSDAVRYEQRGLCELLGGIDLSATRQEKELSRLLRSCADNLKEHPQLRVRSAFARESARLASFGVVSGEDSEPFEALLDELGRCGLREQLRLIDEAECRLRSREETLRTESARRARLTASLGVCCGAAVFLVLI